MKDQHFLIQQLWWHHENTLPNWKLAIHVHYSIWHDTTWNSFNLPHPISSFQTFYVISSDNMLEIQKKGGINPQAKMISCSKSEHPSCNKNFQLPLSQHHSYTYLRSEKLMTHFSFLQSHNHWWHAELTYIILATFPFDKIKCITCM